MPDRFHAPPPARLVVGAFVSLPTEEARHLGQVLRAKPGLVVHLFDGAGRLVEGAVTSISRRDAVVQVTSLLDEGVAAAQSPRLHLACAIPKGDRARWLVEKITELDVASLTPLETARSVVEAGAGKLEKMEQTVLAACKQSRRNRLLKIHAPLSWEKWLMSVPPEEDVWVADPRGTPISSRTVAASTDVHVAIGPEGGLTADELSAAAARGGHLIGLGRHVLRIETAAVTVAAWFALTARLSEPET